MIKRIGHLLAIYFFLIVSAQAQEISEADNVVAKMQAVLNLTQQQVDLIKPIIEEYTSKRYQAIKNFKNAGTIDKSILRTKLKQLKDEEEQGLDKILSQAQIKQWADHQTLTQIMNRDQEGDVAGSLDVYNQGGVAF